jgi:hypothetical protein
LCINGNWSINGNSRSFDGGSCNDWGSGVRRSVGESWGSFGISKSWGSFGIAKSWGSSIGTNSNWGRNSSGNLLMDGVAGLLNDWSLDYLMNGVDLIRFGDSIWLRNLNCVWLGNMSLVNNLFLDWNWVWNRNINRIPVDLEFWLNAPHSGGDLGVSADWSKNLFLHFNQIIV